MYIPHVNIYINLRKTLFKKLGLLEKFLALIVYIYKIPVRKYF